MKRFIGIFTILFFITSSSMAQIIEPKEVVKAKITLEQNGCEAFVVVNVEVKPEWHINSCKLPNDSYAYPSDLKIKQTGEIKIGAITEPKPHVYTDELGDIQSQHEKSFVIKRKVDVLSASDFILTGSFEYQTCINGKCLPPDEYKFSLNVKGCAAQGSTTADTLIAQQEESKAPNNEEQISPPQTENVQEPTAVPESLWMIFILSFISGFAAILTPCVFPMLPMTVTFFTRRSKTRAVGIRNALIYG
ncbi:MAG: protein-disulfide reductase DsbD domain-containing protein, partial [Bacteroidota bacterium]